MFPVALFEGNWNGDVLKEPSQASMQLAAAFSISSRSIFYFLF
jgi:hypothetical protein